MNKPAKRLEQGFTIVELMVATTVLSVILTLATVTMTSIGNLYTKGVNQSTTQDTARDIIDELAQNLELSNGYTKSPDGQSICIGAVRYTLVIGKQLASTNDASHSVHVLWRDTAPSGGCSAAGVNLQNDPASTGGSELVSAHSRLTQFSISPSSPYKITVGVIYGDDDLLTALSGPSAACKGSTGDQFCAVSTLTTTVVPRIHKE